MTRELKDFLKSLGYVKSDNYDTDQHRYEWSHADENMPTFYSFQGALECSAWLRKVDNTEKAALLIKFFKDYSKL